MSTLSNRLEYFPSPSESNGNGHHDGNHNGNGNGHAKIFQLQRTTDPDTLAILDARRNALAEPNDRMNRSMKACFCEVLDRALNPGFFDQKGVVTISDTVLAEIFGVSTRTIYTWKRRIEAAGYVWLTHKFKSNMWPITTYHLSCLHKPRRDAKTDADGTYGGGKFRGAPVSPGLGCRKPGQPSLPLTGSRTPPPEPENADLQGISALSRQKLRLSPEEKIGSEPKPASALSRRKDRLRAEEKIGSEPKKRSGESRSQLPVRAEADCSHKETQIEDQTLSEKGEGKEAPPVGGAGEGKITGWEAEFATWKARLAKKFDRELRDTLKDLEADRQRLKDFPGQDAALNAEKFRRLKLKLDAVRVALKGPA